MARIEPWKAARWGVRPARRKKRRGGHLIRCLVTVLGRVERENIWLYVLMNGHERAKNFLIRRFPLSQYARIIT